MNNMSIYGGLGDKWGQDEQVLRKAFNVDAVSLMVVTFLGGSL